MSDTVASSPASEEDASSETQEVSHIEDLTPSNPSLVCSKGQAIFEQGAPAHQAFFVEEGLLEVVVEEGGQQIKIAEIGPGEVFGEMGALEHKARMATVRALKKSVVTIISRKELENRITQTEDPLIQSIIKQLLQRLRSADEAQIHSQKELALFQSRLSGLMTLTNDGIKPEHRKDFSKDVMPLLEQLEQTLKKYRN